MQTTLPALRLIGRCQSNHVVNVTRDEVADQRTLQMYQLVRCPCGAMAAVRAMNVRVDKSITCGPRCTSAAGPSCDCSCGGREHGADRRA